MTFKLQHSRVAPGKGRGVLDGVSPPEGLAILDGSFFRVRGRRLNRAGFRRPSEWERILFAETPDSNHGSPDSGDLQCESSGWNRASCFHC